MKVYGHIDQNIMFIDSTLAIGLRNYEHILTLATSVLHLQRRTKILSKNAKILCAGHDKPSDREVCGTAGDVSFIHGQKAGSDGFLDKQISKTAGQHFLRGSI